MTRSNVRAKRRLDEIKALEAATTRRWKKLNASKAFLIETDKLTSALERALAHYPKDVKRFFRRFGYPTGRFNEIRQFVSSIRDGQTRSAIAAYPRYVSRFGVLVKRYQNHPHFRPYPLTPWGAVFSVRLKHGDFLPSGPYPGGDEPYIYFYESDPAKVPKCFQPLIRSGAARFVEIEDQDRFSLFTRLETFAYSSDTITFLIHRAEQPYLFCLIGEDVPGSTWRDIGKSVSAFQRTLSGRAKAGRPPDIKRLKKTLSLLKRKKSKKDIAIAVQHQGAEGETDTYSSQSYVSRIRKSLR